MDNIVLLNEKLQKKQESFTGSPKTTNEKISFF